MSATKPAAVEILRGIAALLEYNGENTFKVRAYENAARALASEAATLDELIDDPKRLQQIRGIGKAIAEVIREYATTGVSPYFEELARDAPSGIADLLNVPKLGVKKIKLLHDRLGVNTLADLERVCKSGEVSTLPGFGKAAGETILAAIEQMHRFAGQLILHHALRVSGPLLESIRNCPSVIRAEIAGSVRRWKEVVSDIDVVASSDDPKAVSKWFAELPFVMEVIAQGETKTSVRLDRGLQADLRVVADSEFAAALHHFTGSKEHNTELRALALRKGMLINEYGLFRAEKNGRKSIKGTGRKRAENPTDVEATDRIKVTEEADLFRELGLGYIPPEIREGMGEIAAAASGAIPKLVTMPDYRGVIHCHTNWSDGQNTILEMATAAKEQLAFEYFAVCDHSQLASYAGGIKEADLPKQHEEIDAANEILSSKKFRVLKSCECDILADGALDYSPAALETMDLVVASIHSRFKQTREEITSRLLAAVENPYTTILGHMTGRLLLSRDPYDFDMDLVLKRAAELGTIIEINADPHRLDLDWRHCRRAKDMGVMFAINPDAHDVAAFSYIQYGIAMARKAWLEPKDILNCLPLAAMLKHVTDLRSRKLTGR